MNLTFKKLKIEGFGSIIEEFTYLLDEPGLTILSGPNGAGKSSIFGALFWCLYGKTLKEGSSVTPWEDIKPKDFRGTKVEVSWVFNRVKYKVVRCKEYKHKVEGYPGKNRLLLYQGNELFKGRDVKDTQAEIIKELKLSQNLFKSSVLFGQGLKRLIEQSNPDKKVIFEEAFDVIVFQKAKEAADKKRGEIRDKLKVLEVEYDSIKAQYKLILVVIKGEKDRLETEKADFEARKSKLISDRKTLKLNLKKLKAQAKSLGDLPKRMAESKKMLEVHREELDKKLKIEQKITGLNLEVEGIQHEKEQEEIKYKGLKAKFGIKPKNCPRCGQELNKKEAKEELDRIKKEASNLQVRIKTLERNIEYKKCDIIQVKSENASLLNIKNELSRLQYDYNKLESSQNDYHEAKSYTKMYRKNLRQLNRDWLEIKSEKPIPSKLPDFRFRKKEMKLQKNSLKTSCIKLKKELGIYDWIIKEPLSNSGIKAYVFGTMLNLLNKALQKYSQILGFRVEFNIDLEGSRKDFYTWIYKGDKVRPYEDLSGGQKQLVGICVAFAFDDIRNVNRPCNIMIMDEIFEHLADENIQVVTDLIYQKANTRSIHLITHKADFNSSNAQTINLILTPEGHTART